MSKGRTVFEAAIKNPDILADLNLTTVDSVYEFEDFSYVAREVWQEKTGKSPYTPVNQYIFGGISTGKPKGRRFLITEQYLSKHYPKLWKRFGKTPLL